MDEPSEDPNTAKCHQILAKYTIDMHLTALSKFKKGKIGPIEFTERMDKISTLAFNKLIEVGTLYSINRAIWVQEVNIEVLKAIYRHYTTEVKHNEISN